jgi:hypothetical protein
MVGVNLTDKNAEASVKGFVEPPARVCTEIAPSHKLLLEAD